MKAITGKFSHASRVLLIGFGISIISASASQATFCSNDGARFNEWKQSIKQAFRGKFKASTLAKLNGVNYNTKIIRHDRANRKSFSGGFEAFYQRRARGVTPIARKKWKQYRTYFDRAEQQFGVPAEIILAIWGLETAFGRYSGNFPVLEASATLAYDCRRSESLFMKQFVAGLEVIDRGITDLSQRRGAWAGEIGQTQFLASNFLIAATDYDGGGVDVFNSPPDVIGSTARWFARHGWRAGGSYQPGTANYRVIQQWNAATNYQKTIARLAAEIRG